MPSVGQVKPHCNKKKAPLREPFSCLATVRLLNLRAEDVINDTFTEDINAVVTDELNHLDVTTIAVMNLFNTGLVLTRDEGDLHLRQEVTLSNGASIIVADRSTVSGNTVPIGSNSLYFLCDQYKQTVKLMIIYIAKRR